MSNVFLFCFFYKVVELLNLWRVCYQWGLPRLVLVTFLTVSLVIDAYAKSEVSAAQELLDPELIS